LIIGGALFLLCILRNDGNLGYGARVFVHYCLFTDVRVHREVFCSVQVDDRVATCCSLQRGADRRNGFVIGRYGNVTPRHDATRYTRVGYISHEYAAHSGGSRHRPSISSRALNLVGFCRGG